MYKLLRNILFLFPPETVHQFSMNILLAACKSGLFKKFIVNKFTVNEPGLGKSIWGISFRNQVGLGAGFDKNGHFLAALDCLGFGFVEIGTVTPLPQPGNKKPRLFRLPEDRALINRMGFNNEGVKIVAQRLRKWNRKNREPGKKNPRLIIGGNIGKNKTTPNEEAWKDYETCFLELLDCVDYFVVNVSSPNTDGLRELQEKDALRNILTRLQLVNQKQPDSKPLLLKIAPDLSWQQIDDILALAGETGLNGLVVANTTISRDRLGKKGRERSEKIGPGGLSGAPLQERSTEMIRYIQQKTDGKLPILASGGIFGCQDAAEKFSAGAALVQVWTGFIYEGPSIVKNILRNGPKGNFPN
jgi:dihydroorotate dehydrogenase